MAGSLPIPNAMWWLHYRLDGGGRKLLTFGFVWVAILTAGTMGYRYFDHSTPISSFCDAAIYILTGVQLVLIIPGGCNAIYRALLRDIKTNMLESHRVSPLSERAVIWGYVIGPNFHILLLYAITVLFGALLIRWGTVGVDDWLLGNGYILLVALLPWSGTVLLGISRKKAINPQAVLLVIAVASAPLLMVPGLGLFSGLYAGFAGASLMVGNPICHKGVSAILLLVTLGISLIWARAAMRKYRRPDLPAFGTFRAFGLLLIWLIVSGVGLQVGISGSKQSSSIFQDLADTDSLKMVLVFTIASTMLVSLLPIGAAAHARCRLQRRPGSTNNAALRTAVAPLCCAVLSLTIAGFRARDIGPIALSSTLVAIAASLIAVEALLVLAFALGRRATPTVLAFVVLFWVAPPIVDFFSRQLLAVDSSPYEQFAYRPTVINGLSPIGAILELFFHQGANLRPGIAFQILTALVCSYLAHRALQRRRSSA